MRNWVEPAPIDVPLELDEWLGEQRLLAQVLVRRGITTQAAARAFLDPDTYAAASPTELPDMIPAVERVWRAISSGERICVWGDFDVDGQTATALLVSALDDLGARDVAYYIPDRQREGHGVHIESLAAYVDTGVRLVITCDTGIASHRAVAYARSRGVDVVITDHHNLPDKLPDACAIVNPKRLPQGHPLRELPGVGCAYKLVEQLYGAAATERFLDLVALGIVADVAIQIGDTRYLLQRGLRALRETKRPGLLKVMELADLNPAEITEQHIGFALGPRLNALGRLGDATEAVTLLTSSDPVTVEVLARQLEGLNNQRKLETSYVYNAALRMVESNRSLLDYDALVLSHTDWPGGVIGIAANRLAERFNRPVVLISASSSGIGRGSARSVAGCDITAALTENAGMLRSYGGHAMAAGLTIDTERIPAFRQALGYTVRHMLGGAQPANALPIDEYVTLGDLSLALAHEIDRMAPFGPGNLPVTLATRDLRVRKHRVVGRSGEHLRVVVVDDAGYEQEVMWWQGDANDLPIGRFDLAYTIRVSHFSGVPEILAEWIDTRAVESAAITLGETPGIIVAGDYRRSNNQHTILHNLCTDNHDLLVWREADDQVDGATRVQLQSSPILAVWTAPPGPDEWRGMLERVQPVQLYLFGVDPGVDTVGVFVRRLSGLVKTALKRNVPLAIADLAAATAQRETTIRAGLRLLVAQGHITVDERGEGKVILAAPGTPDKNEPDEIRHEIEWLLRETAAYRQHWISAQRLPGIVERS